MTKNCFLILKRVLPLVLIFSPLICRAGGGLRGLEALGQLLLGFLLISYIIVLTITAILRIRAKKEGFWKILLMGTGAWLGIMFFLFVLLMAGIN